MTDVLSKTGSEVVTVTGGGGSWDVDAIGVGEIRRAELRVAFVIVGVKRYVKTTSKNKVSSLVRNSDVKCGNGLLKQQKKDRKQRNTGSQSMVVVGAKESSHLPPWTTDPNLWSVSCVHVPQISNSHSDRYGPHLFGYRGLTTWTASGR